MSAPYKVLEFTATSGNSARMKVYKSGTMACRVSIGWDREPSELDMSACNEWVAAQVAPPGSPIGITSGKCNLGIELQDAIIESMVKADRSGEN